MTWFWGRLPTYPAFVRPSAARYSSLTSLAGAPDQPMVGLIVCRMRWNGPMAGRRPYNVGDALTLNEMRLVCDTYLPFVRSDATHERAGVDVLRD